MKKYRGYYIDHVVFNSKADIDAFCKDQAMKRCKTLSEMFARKPSIELAAHISIHEKYMHDECGFSYSEIEAIEIEAIKATA